MDLLNERNVKGSKVQEKKQKILILLVISIILTVIILVLISILKQPTPVILVYSVEIDDKPITMTDNLILKRENDDKYINLKLFANATGFLYYNGEYMEFTEQKNKCYVNNRKQIIGFESGNMKIYKTYKINNDANNITDYEYYYLSKNVISYNDEVFISIYDLANAFGFIVNDSLELNKTQIYSPNYFATLYEEQLKSLGYANISKEYENLKVLNKGIIVANKEGQYGLIGTDYVEKTGSKYSNIQYSELLNEFIVCSNNKYGMLNIDGTQKLTISYDEIKIIKDGEYILYQVKKNDKYGVCKQDGEMIIETEYDSIGSNGDDRKNIEPETIISTSDRGDMIIVCKNNRYGLISLEDEEVVMKCVVKSIFIKKEASTESEIPYVIDENNYENTLKLYLDYLNSQKITVE